MARSKQHLEALLNLPPAERSMAAEALLLSLEDGDVAEVAQQAWIDELERRVSVAAEGTPAEDVFAQRRERLKRSSASRADPTKQAC